MPKRHECSTSSPSTRRAVQPALAPHGIYTASEPTLAWVAEQSATRGVPVHIHFLETQDEVTGCVDRTGERPGAYLDRLGMLSPRLLLAHGVWMEEPELELVAERGATVVTNPVSNLKLAVGRVFPYPKVRAPRHTRWARHRRRVVEQLARSARRRQGARARSRSSRPTTLPRCRRARRGRLPPARSHPCSAALPSSRWGSPPTSSSPAPTAPELAPGHVLDNLVYAASGSVVSSTVVGGRVLMRDGTVGESGGAEEEEVRAHVVECARRLGVL